jgi:hypothetical protein
MLVKSIEGIRGQSGAFDGDRYVWFVAFTSSRNNILIDLDNAYSPFADRIQCHSSTCENWGQSGIALT